MKPEQQIPLISIEKAILADVCLGIPLGKILFDLPVHPEDSTISPDDRPETYLFRGKQLALMKHLYQKKHATVFKAVDALVTIADETCKTDPFSVTDKPVSRFSDNPHDYQSLAKYAWPEDDPPESAQQYTLRDGQINPECYSNNFDYLRLIRFSETVVLLSLAAYLSGKHTYAETASNLCRVWFLNPDTCQTPHFSFSQVIPGSIKLRWQGIIEARFLIYVTEAIRLLETCNAFNKTELTSLRIWFSELLDWMQHSEQGLSARKARNNIGFWYDLQRLVYADFCGRSIECDQIIRESILPRLEKGVLEDGSLPHELMRAYPHDYVAFSLTAMALISRSAEKEGISLWEYNQSDGRNFQVAHDWLLKATRASSLLAKISDSNTRPFAPWQDLGQILDMGIQLRTMHRIAKTSTTSRDTLVQEQAKRNKEHDKLNQEHSKLKQEHDKLKAEHQDLKKKITRIKSSFSWRLTSPLRLPLKTFRTIKQSRKNSKNKKTADPLQLLTSHRIPREKKLRQQYLNSDIAKMDDTFVLYRIIGNDLVPRHKKGQARENLRFVLKNEPPLSNCEKRWVVNRIFDQNEEQQIIGILEANQQPYLHIPFDANEYKQIGWDLGMLPSPGFLASQEFRKLEPEQQERARTALYRLKNNYVMHNNGARNIALRDGLKRAKWVLPWDGNCFITAAAWEEIARSVTQRPHLRYFAVPMDRITDNDDLLRDDYQPNPVEEPQLLFRCDADAFFNDAYPYGRRPKIELFWRLGIPGTWDRWKDDPWDQPRREQSVEHDQFGVAGWVARMYSGVKNLEANDKEGFKKRGLKRQKAIRSAIDHIDARTHANPCIQTGLTFYSDQGLKNARQALSDPEETPLKKLAQNLIEKAEQVLLEEPYAVTQKTTLPPGGDIHDYWHPAPYWWPNPDSRDGLPYVRKDGQRIPGTRMYEPESAKYDRTRLQRMLDGTTILALAWYLTGREDFARHGSDFVRSWFLEPETKMNPHLRYAQVRMGHNHNEGAQTGIIEFKDLYYFLDALHLLERSNALTGSEIDTFKAWLYEYLNWLETSRQGKKELIATNNHGTCFDLQVGAITAYLDEKEKFRDVIFRALSRIPQQFTADGEQPEEMIRSITQHYCFFNLQGWLNIIKLAQANNFPHGQLNSEPLRRIDEACKWISQNNLNEWPYDQIEPFNNDRQYPLLLNRFMCGFNRDSSIEKNQLFEKEAIFDPHEAVEPYWNINAAAF